jgi:putative membrane protein
MLEYNRFSWWRTTFSLKGTALPRAAARVLFFTAYCAAVTWAFEAAADEAWFVPGSFKLDPVGHAVVGSLLGFLIVFRMNASNMRYWEGRSHWGQVINSSRNLVRVGCEHTVTGEELAGLVTGFAVCLRRSLQGHRDTEGAELYLPADVNLQAATFGNPPTAVAAAISEWIGRHFRAGVIDAQRLRTLEVFLGYLVDSQGGCEKIQKTPMPFAYVAMIKQLIVVYLLTLPLALCEPCGWWSPLLMAVVSLALLGMEEASVEIEDPFGTHDNCLDMGRFTLTIARDCAQLANRAAHRDDSGHATSDVGDGSQTLRPSAPRAAPAISGGLRDAALLQDSASATEIARFVSESPPHGHGREPSAPHVVPVRR